MPWGAPILSSEELGHASQILHGRSQGEIVSHTHQATQSYAVEFHDPFEVGELHLHLLPFATRDEVFRCLGDESRHVTSRFVDAPSDLAECGIEAALRFQRAGGAVGLAGAEGDGLGQTRSFLGEGTPFTA